MFSSLLGFRSLSSISDKITGVLRSILWSFQVFERRRPPEMSLEWINHQPSNDQMINIFPSNKKNSHFFQRSKRVNELSLLFLSESWLWKSSTQKWHFPGGKYASSRGFGLLTNFCSPLKHRNPAWRTSSHKSMRLCFREGRSKSTSL